MHDIRKVRDNPEAFDQALGRRGLKAASAELLKLDEELRKTQTALQELQQRRNKASEQVAVLKREGKDSESVQAEMKSIKQETADLQNNETTLKAKLKAKLEVIPNFAKPDVPDGKDEADNIEVHKWGEATTLSFEAKRHFDLGEDLGLMDFETAANLSGARFVILRGALSRLERALANFMLDIHINENGYEETSPPTLVRSETVYGTGQLPKFAEDLFHTEDDFWLIPTAEVPLTAQAMGKTYEADQLPLRYTAFTPCFRSEAGAAGKDTRGMIRQHQFYKVEMVSLTLPDQSDAELERMRKCAEGILERLELPYRTIVLCTGDMGFGSQKTYDLEVWLPGEKQYREISSCSTCGDFQARRMNGRFKQKGEKGTEFIHTLNGSGLAVGRCLIAILENYQNEDGSITIPKALQPYMGGADKITKP